MKKIVLAVMLAVFLCVPVYADRINLNQEESIDAPVSQRLDWYIDYIDAATNTIIVEYRWIDANETPIRDRDSFRSWHTWIGHDIPDNPATDVTQCIGPGDPWPCCTGIGEGDCDETVTTFSDIFRFEIRSQDVGMKIGVGLRTLIWNKMKQDILTPGNDGTFVNE